MTKPRSSVGVIILNWNGLELTDRCLASLRKQTYGNFLTIVVDNGSTDGSVDWLRKQKDIELIENRVNAGFAKAVNQGINKALERGCEYVISLNNDTTLDPDWLRALASYMDRHPTIGFAQGANLQADKPDLFDSSGIYLERGFIPNQRALGQLDAMTAMPAIGPNAAGALYRAEMLRAVQQKNGDYFDSRFFAYVEDVDFDLRCTLRGYEFAFVPEAKLYHVGSATGNRIAKKKMYWGARNLVWLVYKNAPRLVIKKTSKLIVKSHLANLQFLWREQRPNFLPYLRGLLVGVICLPRFYLDRRSNLRSQRISNEEFFALLVPSNPPLANPLKKLLNLIK